MWGAAYDEDDGWVFDHRWPGLARQWLEAWHATDGGDPRQWIGRTWGDANATYQADLEAWPTPQDFGLGVNVDWERGARWGRSDPDRMTAALHLGFLVVTLTLWRRRPPAPSHPDAPTVARTF